MLMFTQGGASLALGYFISLASQALTSLTAILSDSTLRWLLWA